MGPGLMSKRQKEARKRQSFPGGLAADLSQASGVAKKAAAPKRKAKEEGKKASLDGFYGYGVYVCLPKSVIRHVIRHVYAP